MGQGVKLLYVGGKALDRKKERWGGATQEIKNPEGLKIQAVFYFLSETIKRSFFTEGPLI